MLSEKEKHNMPMWLFSQLLFRFWLSQLMLWPDGAPHRQDRRPERAEGPLCSHCHLQPAVPCSPYLLSGSLFRMCSLVETDKTAKLRHIKHHIAQKVSEADPTAASGLLRLSCSLRWETGHPHHDGGRGLSTLTVGSGDQLFFVFLLIGTRFERYGW